MEQKNVRFWIYWNCPTKITLKPGQVINICQGGPTEEGFHYHSETYTYDVEYGKVYRETNGISRDCDGRFEQHCTEVCGVEDLKLMHNDYVDIDYPKWEDVEHSQRDYSAEAMGY